MKRDAEELGANAVIGFRFSTSTIEGGAAEVTAYGTAVLVEKKLNSFRTGNDYVDLIVGICFLVAAVFFVVARASEKKDGEV